MANYDIDSLLNYFGDKLGLDANGKSPSLQKAKAAVSGYLSSSEPAHPLRGPALSVTPETPSKDLGALQPIPSVAHGQEAVQTLDMDPAVLKGMDPQAAADLFQSMYAQQENTRAGVAPVSDEEWADYTQPKSQKTQLWEAANNGQGPAFAAMAQRKGRY